jgi:Ni,Fe-hydrogenase maturation factor
MRKSILGIGNSMCKGPGAGVYLVYWRHSKEAKNECKSGEEEIRSKKWS